MKESPECSILLKKRERERRGSVKATLVHELYLGVYRKLTKIGDKRKYICHLN